MKDAGKLLWDAADAIVRDADLPTTAIAWKDGKLTLYLGRMFMEGSSLVRRELLNHEAGHFLQGHHLRMAITLKDDSSSRDILLFGMAADAAMHHYRHCHADDPRMVSFDKLGLPPMPVEIAWQILRSRPPVDMASSCSSLSHGASDGSARSTLREVQLLEQFHEAGFTAPSSGAGAGSAGGWARTIGEIRRLPPWMSRLITLLECRARQRRVRSWRRENKYTDLLPGRSRQRGLSVQFFVDSSGSMSDESLAMLAGAIQACPSLAGEVYFFSDVVMGPFAVSRLAGRSVPTGGTLYGPPAALRRDAVVWLTDGYPCDTWPTPHTDLEVWGITTSQRPPYPAVVVEIR